MSQHKIARRLVSILLLAVILRVGVAAYLGDSTPPAKDETSYSMLGLRLATGHGYSFPVDWYPFAQANAPTSHWSFLYTGLVAGIYSVAGAHPLAVRLLQAIVCGLLMPLLTYRLSRRIFAHKVNGEALALLAALLAAIYAYFVLYGAMVQTEALFICAVLWSLERALILDMQLADLPTGKGSLIRTSLTLGLSLGVATLLRQSIMPWVLVLWLWLLVTGWRAHYLRAAVAVLAISAFVVALCIAPFTLRNLRVYGDFLLLNSNSGYAMYSAQHPLHGIDFQAYTAAPLPVDLLDQGLNEAQWDRVLMQRGLGFVLADPQRYVLLSISRVGDYLEFWPTPDSSLLFNVGRLLSFTALLPFMLVGICVAWKERNGLKRHKQFLLLPDPVALSLLFVFFYSLLHVLTWAMTRYRLPVDAVLLPYAALGLITAWQWIVKRIDKERKEDIERTRLAA